MDFFIELLSVAEPDLITEAVGRQFSFGAFNKTFLAKREGREHAGAWKAGMLSR